MNDLYKINDDLLDFINSISQNSPELYKKILLGPTEINNINKAVECMRAGGIVIFFSFATYGIAANAWLEESVKKVYEIKYREKNKPLTIMTNKDKYQSIVDLTDDVKSLVSKLTQQFWPGNIGIVCNKNKEQIPDYVNSAFETINMTCMDLSSEMLAQAADFPIAITSANYSGFEPAKDSYMAIDYFKDEEKIDLFLLGPPSPIGMNTTMVKITHPDNLEILREGPLTKEEILSKI